MLRRQNSPLARQAFIVLLLLGCSAADTSAQTAVNPPGLTGYGDVYTHDQMGNRFKRNYVYTMITQKSGGQEYPIDTLKQQFSLGFENKIQVKAYPNPVANELVVEHLSWKGDHTATVKIFDITGKQLQTKSFKAAKDYFSLAGVVPGTYQVHYYLDSKLITTWKIIKK